MSRDDDWVQLAMVNDAVVVELLIQIHQAPPPPPRRIKSTESEPLPLDWSVRQPRSKPLSVNNSNNKKSRSSPTTPLSWSGACASSFSGGGSADGIEELSSGPQAPPPPPPLDASRSKVSVGRRTRLSCKSKRPRKKKSIDELREEENLLDKERRQLKKELAALRIDIEKQRGINENLKRLKLAVETTTKAITTSFSQNVCAGSGRTSNNIPFLPDLNIACGDPENL